jgi:hypothetical protein
MVPPLNVTDPPVNDPYVSLMYRFRTKLTASPSFIVGTAGEKLVEIFATAFVLTVKKNNPKNKTFRIFLNISPPNLIKKMLRPIAIYTP